MLTGRSCSQAMTPTSWLAFFSGVARLHQKALTSSLSSRRRIIRDLLKPAALLQSVTSRPSGDQRGSSACVCLWGATVPVDGCIILFSVGDHEREAEPAQLAPLTSNSPQIAVGSVCVCARASSSCFPGRARSAQQTDREVSDDSSGNDSSELSLSLSQVSLRYYNVASNICCIAFVISRCNVQKYSSRS